MSNSRWTFAGEITTAVSAPSLKCLDRLDCSIPSRTRDDNIGDTQFFSPSLSFLQCLFGICFSFFGIVQNRFLYRHIHHTFLVAEIAYMRSDACERITLASVYIVYLQLKAVLILLQKPSNQVLTSPHSPCKPA